MWELVSYTISGNNIAFKEDRRIQSTTKQNVSSIDDNLITFF
jgi:hypothetical protein